MADYFKRTKNNKQLDKYGRVIKKSFKKGFLAEDPDSRFVKEYLDQSRSMTPEEYIKYLQDKNKKFAI